MLRLFRFADVEHFIVYVFVGAMGGAPPGPRLADPLHQAALSAGQCLPARPARPVAVYFMKIIFGVCMFFLKAQNPS